MTEQPPLSTIIKRRRLSLFGHIARVDGEVDANRILFEPHRSSGEDHQVNRAPPGSKTSTMTWPRLTWSWWRQEMQLRIDLSGECWLLIALRTHSGACYYCIWCDWLMSVEWCTGCWWRFCLCWDALVQWEWSYWSLPSARSYHY